jgi:hypothetical protein
MTETIGVRGDVRLAGGGGVVRDGVVVRGGGVAARGGGVADLGGAGGGTTGSTLAWLAVTGGVETLPSVNENTRLRSRSNSSTPARLIVDGTIV